MSTSVMTIVRRVLLLAALPVLLGCYPDPEEKPAWIEELQDELRCGMTLEQVQELTRRRVSDLEGGHWFWGGHRISTSWHDLWLKFDGNGLRTVAWGAAVDSKNTRLSPRLDICDHEIAFLVNVVWTYDYTSTDVYLDGKPLGSKLDNCPPLLLGPGHHTLRVEVPGFEPVTRELRLTPEDRGDQELRLGAKDLQPLARED